MIFLLAVRITSVKISSSGKDVIRSAVVLTFCGGLF
jgi:hypothetical protein